MKKLILSLIFVLISPLSFASSPSLSPYQVAEQVGQSLFTRIAREKVAISSQPQLMQQIVEQELMPYIDYKYAAYKILGKNLKYTSKEQREKFVDTMRDYLVQTYANALNQYDDQQVVFEQGPTEVEDKIVPVTATIKGEKDQFKIVFRMRQNSNTNEWKAFDMVVEGASLLSAKQAEITSKIRLDGIDKVTQDLAQLSAI